jgi:hypothetical protein
LAKRSTPKGRKKSAAEKQLEQSKRFEAAARKVGADETGGEFERAFQKIVGSKKK